MTPGKLLWDNWNRHARSKPDAEAIVFMQAGCDAYRWTWGSLAGRAIHYAHRLRDSGIRRGEVCALILTHHREFYPLYMALSALGAIPAVLAYPNARLHPDKFRHGLKGMSRSSGLDWVITSRDLEGIVAPLALGEETTVRGILFPLESDDGARHPDVGVADLDAALSELDTEVDPHRTCLLQHSSGTTGLQKGVALSHQAVLEHTRRYGDTIGATNQDKVASWLPLYHDMGLIAAFHLPLALGIPLVHISPFEWVNAPVLLFEAISDERATLVWLPNFAYNVMADRIHEEDLETIRLDSLRMVTNCSEPVLWESHQRFLERFTPHGLKAEALGACYAMAETTFAVSQTRPGSAPQTLCADSDAMALGYYRPARLGSGGKQRLCVSSGPVISGCSVKVVDGRGATLAADEIGEIAIRSVSLFDGYRNNPVRTEEVMHDGWYHSGDLGFVHGGECFVVGRVKDVIIMAGKNIYPEDVEAAVSQLPLVLPGRVVAFGRVDPEMGTEQVCVIAETSERGGQSLKELRRSILETGMSVDVTISEVFLVPARWLTKTSAGKLCRSTNRQRVISEGISPCGPDHQTPEIVRRIGTRVDIGTGTGAVV